MSLVPATRSRLHATLAGVITGLIWWHYRTPFSLLLAGGAATLAALAWLSPRRYAPVQAGLDRVARGVAAGFSWSILALVYFGVFTPLRLLRSLSGRRLLTRRPDRRPHAPGSYLQPLRPRAPGHFDRQF